MSKHKYGLCMDIMEDKILLSKILKKFDNGLVETDGYNEDVTQDAVQCVIRQMAHRCKAEARPNLTYEIEGLGKITFTPPTKENDDERV